MKIRSGLSSKDAGHGLLVAGRGGVGEFDGNSKANEATPKAEQFFLNQKKSEPAAAAMRRLQPAAKLSYKGEFAMAAQNAAIAAISARPLSSLPLSPFSCHVFSFRVLPCCLSSCRHPLPWRLSCRPFFRQHVMPRRRYRKLRTALR